MLHLRQLTELHRRFQDTWLLSVYIDGDETDPSERTAWRRTLEGESRRLGDELADHPPSDLATFKHARAGLEGYLDRYDGFLPSPGWVGFITEGGIHHSESLPIRVPTVVAWQKGVVLTPYLRVLNLAYPTSVVLCDHGRSRLLRQRDGHLTEARELTVDRSLQDFSDVSMMKSAHVATGVRGATARDAAQRSLVAESQQLVRRTVKAVVDLTGHEGSVIIGGPSDVASALRAGLPEPLGVRTTIVPGLELDMTVTEVARSIAPLLDEIRDHEQGEILRGIIDSAHPGGRGTLGIRNTNLALDQGAVDMLLVSRRFAEGERSRVESLVGSTLLQGGEVAELSGGACDLLDTEGGGSGARLRFSVL